MDSKDWLYSQPINPTGESSSATAKSNITPTKEFLLQGSIMDTSVEVLLHRLRGLCDNVDSGAPEPFYDQEMCFAIRGNAISASTPQNLYLRVRRALDSTERDLPCQLRYTGEPEIGTGDKARPTIVRTSIDVAITPTIVEFLAELGARIEYEYVARGYLFRKGRMKITVSKICRVPREGQNKQEDLISQSYLVELSVLAPSGQDAIAEEMKAFAEQLKPLVHLDKIDYKRLPHPSIP